MAIDFNIKNNIFDNENINNSNLYPSPSNNTLSSDHNTINYKTNTDKIIQKINYKNICFFINATKNESTKKEYCRENENHYNNIKKICSKYDLFCYYLDSTTTKIHHDGSRYISQGCCQIGNTTLITCYDSGYTSNYWFSKRDTIRNSILEITDEYGNEKILYFDHTCHVGGISYSNDFEKIYVTRNAKDNQLTATINCYNINTIATLPNESNLTEKTYKMISLPECTHVSYLTVNDDNLFVGDFSNNKVVKYKLSNDGTEVKYETTYYIPFEEAQGMCLFKYNGKEYYAFSCSYGRNKDSRLIISTLENNQFNLKKQIKLPCMSEQISIDSNGNLMIVFENDCMKYKYGADCRGFSRASTSIGSVCHLNLERIMYNINE